MPCRLPMEEDNENFQAGVLTSEEVANVFLYHTAHEKPTLSFPVGPRPGLPLQKVHRFHSSAYRSNQWRYRGRTDSIQFSVSHRIFIAGIGLYGSSNGASDYKVKTQLKLGNRLLHAQNSRFHSDGSSNTFPVLFEIPIQLDASVTYTISVVIDGNELSYFGQEGHSLVTTASGVEFHFQSSGESTNGTGVQGGQIPEVLFFCSTAPVPERVKKVKAPNGEEAGAADEAGDKTVLKEDI